MTDVSADVSGDVTGDVSGDSPADAPAGLNSGFAVAAARLWAADRFPYLASALFALEVSEVPELGGVQVDEWWRIGLDPDVVAGWSSAELGAELVHSTTHLLRDHAERARQVGLSDQAELAHWVDAADAEIADDFPPDLARGRPIVTPADLDADDGALAESYWRTTTPRRFEDHDSNGVSRGVLDPLCDCGSGAHGQTAPWEPPPPTEGGSGVDRDQQQLLRQKVAGDIAAAGSAAPDGLRRWAEAWQRPQVDWRRLLAGELQRALLAAQGATDYSYSRPSRRASASPGIVLASLRSPEVRVAVVIDTSASVTEGELSLALAEVDGLLASVGVREVRVVVCDDAVHSVAAVRRASEIQLYGGGGTDLGVGLAAAIEANHPPSVVVVITDGFTPWPERPPSAGRPPRVVVARLAGEQMAPGLARPDLPSWASVVDLVPDRGGAQ